MYRGYQDKRIISEKVDFFKVSAYATLILTFLGAGFWFGIYFQSTKLDNNKAALEKRQSNLLDSVDRLHVQLENDSISRNNWVLLNTHYLSFNNDSSSLPTLTVTNHTVRPCYYGSIDGCWKKVTTAKIGDIISVLIFCKNTGQLPVSDVKLGCTTYSFNSDKVIACRGGIAVGNLIVSQGLAHVFVAEGSKLEYMDQLTKEAASHNIDLPKSFEKDSTWSSPTFKIGTVTPQKPIAFVVNFRVVKADRIKD